MTVASLIDICRNFPVSPLVRIDRESQLDAIETALNGNIRVLLVDGDEGIGKTSLLAQLMERAPEKVIGLFIPSIGNIAYSKEYITTSLAEQIYYLLNGSRHPDDFIGESELFKIVLRLQRHAKTNPVYFAIDGLENLKNNEKSEIINFIFSEKLPLSIREFKYVIAGNHSTLKIPSMEKFPSQTQYVLPFDKDQVKKYFEEFPLDEKDISDIKSFSMGNPSRLEAILTSMRTGETLENILSLKNGAFESLFNLEWSKISFSKDSDGIIALAVCVFARNPLSIEDISRITGKTTTNISLFFKTVSFLEFSSLKDPIRFRSDVHRRISSKKLLEFRDLVSDLTIRDYASRSTDIESIVYLPEELADAGKDEQVVASLSTNHFETVLEKEQSLQVIKKHAHIGIIAAQKINKIPVCLQYAMTGAVVNDLESTLSSRNLVQALLRLKMNEEAISYASSSSTKEDRFVLLAQIGHYLVTNKQQLPFELKEQILSAAKNVDFSSLGSRTGQLANDLVALDPDLAIEVLQAGAELHKSKKDKDVAFISLHLAASALDVPDDAENNISRKMVERIGDVKLQAFAEAASAIFSKYSAEQVIEKLDRLEFEHRVYFVRSWLDKRYKDEQAAKVAEYALNIIVAKTEYVPKLADFLAISKVLPYMNDIIKATELKSVISMQKGLAAAHGTSEIYIRIQMLFLMCEARLEIEKACERAVDIYSQVDDISDIATRIACFSWILHYLCDCANIEEIEENTNIRGACATRLMSCSSELLNSTFDHYSVLARSISALTPNHFTLATELAKKLNTASARNKAHRLISLTLTSNKEFLDGGYENLFLSLTSITKIVERDHATLDALAKIKEHGNFSILAPGGDQVKNSWKSMIGADCKLLALATTRAILQQNHLALCQSLNLEENLKIFWDEISDSGYKLDLGFQVVDLLAECDTDTAEKWLSSLLKDYATRTLPSTEMEISMSAVIAIAIRTMAGVLKTKTANDMQWERLVALIRRLPGSSEQITLWSELAVRCWLAGDMQKCHIVVNNYIIPIIDSMKEEYLTWRIFIVSESATALYLSSPNLADSYLSNLPQLEQDNARTSICITLNTKISPNDPTHDEGGRDTPIDYATALDIVSVLKKIKMDSNVFHVLSLLCDSLSSKKTKPLITYSQKLKITVDLQAIINVSFPDPENISHYGYKIASEAKILRVLSEFQKIPVQKWDDLKEAAHQIPNTADRALVLCIVALQAASKEPARAKLWLSEARAIAATISSVKDKIDRLRWMSQLVGKSDNDFCILNLREAFSLTREFTDEPEIEEKQRRILDIAYQIDHKLADELLEQFDIDPARNQAKSLKGHLKVLQSRKRTFERDIDDTVGLSDEELVEVSLKNLRSLLAGKFTTTKPEQTLNLLRRAAKMPIRDAKPIWSFFIENMNRRVESVPKEVSLLGTLLDRCLDGAELACHLAGRSTSSARATATRTNVFKDGDRREALSALRSWIDENADNEIILSDPYFGPEELEIVKLIQELKPEIKVRLLLSSKFLKTFGSDGSLADVFLDKWSEISDEDPPRTEIVVVGVRPDGYHPIHERWLIAGKNGLRIGTSIHSLGFGRTSEISVISTTDVPERKKEIEAFLGRNEKIFKGERVSYSVIDLY